MIEKGKWPKNMSCVMISQGHETILKKFSNSQKSIIMIKVNVNHGISFTNKVIISEQM